MTLSQQTTFCGADDTSVFNTQDNIDDMQTDDWAHATTSATLEKEILKLSMSGAGSEETKTDRKVLLSGLGGEDSMQSDSTAQRTDRRKQDRERGDGIAGFQRQSCRDSEAEHTAHSMDCTSSKKTSNKAPNPALCLIEKYEKFPDLDGDTELHLAVLQGVRRLSGLIQLMGLQDLVNIRNRLYQTPLHLAALVGNRDAVTTLLSLGASRSLQDSHGNTPLHTACLRNDFRTLKILCELGLGEEQQAVCRTKSGGVVETELQSGQRRERDVKTALCTRNYDGFTCLHLAVIHGHLDVTTLLLHSGADVNTRDGKSGRSALHLAVDNADPRPGILSTLLLHPALDINAVTFAQHTALQLARGRRHWPLVDLLYLHGAQGSRNVYSFLSEDSFSEEDMEDELCPPDDDLCMTDPPVHHTHSTVS